MKIKKTFLIPQKTFLSNQKLSFSKTRFFDLKVKRYCTDNLGSNLQFMMKCCTKIFVTLSSLDFESPWNKKSVQACYGSGFVRSNHLL